MTNDLHNADILVGKTSADWEPGEDEAWFAQVLPDGKFAFGATRAEALAKLEELLKEQGNGHNT